LKVLIFESPASYTWLGVPGASAGQISVNCANIIFDDVKLQSLILRIMETIKKKELENVEKDMVQIHL
jgi:hypothetical protein